jgi:hypothetical protein
MSLALGTPSNSCQRDPNDNNVTVTMAPMRNQLPPTMQMLKQFKNNNKPAWGSSLFAALFTHV